MISSQWRVDKIPTLQDNFVFVINDGSRALVVDPGVSDPVISYLKKQKLVCEAILITHHHGDHTDGVPGLVSEYKCEVFGPLKQQSRPLKEGEHLDFDGISFQVIALAGHTMGHIAYWQPDKKWLFSGDVLFALGCGRVFEGTYETMYEALGKIKALPDDSLVFCAHDYYQNNKKFCEQYELKVQGYQDVHPLKLSQEKQYNPFLNAADLSEFRTVRDLRNQF